MDWLKTILDIIVQSFRWLAKHFQPIAIILALLFAAVAFIGLHFFKLLELPTLSETGGYWDDHSWAERMASENAKPYAMLSIVQHIQVEDVRMNGNIQRKATFRNHYTMKFLKDISRRESVFQEFYSTNHNHPVEVWVGSERTDSDEVQSGRYNIFFEGKKGEIKTIMTGSTLTYDFPLQTGNETCFGNIRLDNDQWVWCYPNDEDYVDELMIIVEAKHLQLNADVQDIYFRNVNQDISRFDPVINRLRNTDRHTIKAYKNNVSPGECVALVTRWSTIADDNIAHHVTPATTH